MERQLLETLTSAPDRSKQSPLRSTRFNSLKRAPVLNAASLYTRPFRAILVKPLLFTHPIQKKVYVNFDDSRIFCVTVCQKSYLLLLFHQCMNEQLLSQLINLTVALILHLQHLMHIKIYEYKAWGENTGSQLKQVICETFSSPFHSRRIKQSYRIRECKRDDAEPTVESDGYPTLVFLKPCQQIQHYCTAT